MKKFFIILVVLVGLSGYSYATSTKSETTVCTTSEASSTQNVRAREIKRIGNGNGWSKRYVNATYDSDSQKLYVGDYSYDVYRNDLYQKVDDSRGEYQYVAGNFYFNL